jgi:hypothetical protein
MGQEHDESRGDVGVGIFITVWQLDSECSVAVWWCDSMKVMEELV